MTYVLEPRDPLAWESEETDDPCLAGGESSSVGVGQNAKEGHLKSRWAFLPPVPTLNCGGVSGFWKENTSQGWVVRGKARGRSESQENRAGRR